MNKILSHPTMNVTITGSTDRKIRYFDNNSGQLIHSSVAHVESISTLSSDPNGLILLSGSDDGSVRVWNMESKVCLQVSPPHLCLYMKTVLNNYRKSRHIVKNSTCP